MLANRLYLDCNVSEIDLCESNRLYSQSWGLSTLAVGAVKSQAAGPTLMLLSSTCRIIL